MTDLRMPSLGSDMVAGTLVAWRRAPGDRVVRGDVVAEVETEKGILEIEAYEGGVIESLLVTPGTRVPVGTALARLGEPGSSTPRSTDVPGPARAPEPAPSVTSAPATTSAGLDSVLRHVPPSVRRRSRERGEDPLAILAERLGRSLPPVPASPAPPARARISPRARRLAEQLGVDVATVRAAGDAITADDVARAAREHAPPNADDATTRMRRAIAASMERSNREIPHYWVSTTIDLDALTTWLARANEARDVEHRLVPGALLLKAAALALRRVPELNATWSEGRAQLLDRVHLGVAVSLRGGGLVAPAIRDADTIDLDAMMRALADVVARARAGRLRASELASATCTVTSLGERGVESVMPRIAPPQSSMIGLGRIVTRPWVVGSAVVPRPVITATLAGDHRVSDGHRGAAFLGALDALLQTPEAL